MIEPTVSVMSEREKAIEECIAILEAEASEQRDIAKHYAAIDRVTSDAAELRAVSLECGVIAIRHQVL